MVKTAKKKMIKGHLELTDDDIKAISNPVGENQNLLAEITLKAAAGAIAKGSTVSMGVPRRLLDQDGNLQKMAPYLLKSKASDEHLAQVGLVKADGKIAALAQNNLVMVNDEIMTTENAKAHISSGGKLKEKQPYLSAQSDEYLEGLGLERDHNMKGRVHKM